LDGDVVYARPVFCCWKVVTLACLCNADPYCWPGILHFFTSIVAEPPADAVVANPHAAILAEAISDAKVPSLAAVVVGMTPGAVPDLLGAAAAELAAAVVAAPSAISLAKPLDASTAAATLTASNSEGGCSKQP